MKNNRGNGGGGDAINFNQYKDIFNAAASGMRLIDNDFNIKVVNEAFLNLVNLPEDQIVGRKCYDVFQGALCKTDKCPLVKLIKYPDKKYSVETVKQDALGKKISVLLSAVLFHDLDNQPIGIVEDFTDLTKWKEMEKKLKAYNQQLLASNQQLKASDQQVRAANQQLQATEQQLRAANQQLIAAEMQARLNAVKYKALFDGLNDAAFVHRYKADGFSKFVEVNKVAIKKLGYSREEFFQLTAADISAPDDVLLQGNPQRRGNLAENGFTVFEAVHTAKDGTKIPVEISSRLFEYNNEKHILSVARDISDRKQAEEALTKEHSLLINTLESMNDAFVALDKNWCYTYMNANAGKIFNRNPKEMLGKHIWTEFPEGVGQPFQINYEKAMREGISITMEAYYPPYNKWFENRIFPTDEGISIFFTDITARKQHELIQKIIYNISNAVISSINMKEFVHVVKNELNRVIDTTNFYIALYDESSDSFTMASQFDEKDSFESFPAAKTLTGYVQRTKQTVVADKTKQNELEALDEIELVGAPSKIWIGVPLLIDGNCIGVVTVQSYTTARVFDKSDIEMLEIVARQISISINRKKQEEELQKALEKALESDRLKTAFLTNMSHEIRTPMNGILGFTSLLKEADFTESEKEEFIKSISVSSKRLLSTVNDIIEISKIESGVMKVSHDLVSVKDMMKELLTFFKPEAEQKGIALTTFPLPDLLEDKLYTDDAKLHGILTNLIKNAIKFTIKGAVFFGVTVLEKGESPMLEFFVEDTGIGIPADRQQAIFDRFVQADIADTRVFEGSGL
ncbi:MAG: hypothetical protein DRJ09_12620, partial [Bacteroidetes bacterium]